MSVEKLLEERGSNYGDFSDCARIQQALKFAAKNQTRYDGLPDIMRESIDMVCHKLGRILNGNPFHADSWQDIIGYCQLVIDRIEDGKGLKPNLGQERRPDDPTELLRRTDIPLDKLSEEGRFDLDKAVKFLQDTPPRLSLGKTFDLMQSRMTESRYVGGEFKVGDIEPPVVPRREPTVGQCEGSFLQEAMAQKVRPDPEGQGGPGSGGHHARQAEELRLTPEDVGTFFRTRDGRTVQVVAWRDSKNFPVDVLDDNRRLSRTVRGRVNWQIAQHADAPGDLMERVEAVVGGVA